MLFGRNAVKLRLNDLEALQSSRAINAITIALLAAFITVGAVATIMTARGLARSTQWVEHTLQVRDLLRTTASSVAEAESANRGFLIAEETTYLQPFDAAISELPAMRDRLLALSTDNPVQNRRIEELFDEIDTKIANMRGLQEIATTQSFAAARQNFDADLGLAMMRKIVSDSDSIIAEEERLLRERQAIEAGHRVTFFVLLLALLAATITLAAIAFTSARRQLKLAESDKEATHLLNLELEERVRARTADLEVARERAETEAASAERERRRVELLLRDVNHRVGNNLSMVSALLGMQAMKTGDPSARAALSAARERVFVIGSAQRRLRLGDDMQSTMARDLFTRVVNDLVDSFPHEVELEIHHDYDDVALDSRDAVTLAVVLGELVTNALKHAFAKKAKGTIWTSFRRNEDDILVLGVSDDGAGLGGSVEEKGIGSTVVNEMSRQFGGSIMRGERPGGGALVSVSLPQLKPFEAAEDTPEGGKVL